MFCVEANCATVCLQGTHAIRFFQLLEPTHVPPHRLAFMRIVRLLDKAVLREYQRIVVDNALLYGVDFVSTNSDFYTNRERRQSFGCIVSNMMAQPYIFNVCCNLFSAFLFRSKKYDSHFFCTCSSLYFSRVGVEYLLANDPTMMEQKI
jgi:hypothetical protein